MTENDDRLNNLKRQYLFDPETGMIRQGLTSMKKYAEIFYAEDEEDLDKIITKMVEEESVTDIDGIEDLEIIDEDE